MYANYLKRGLDFFLALLTLLILSPVFAVLMVLGSVAMRGNPFFTQLRPGKEERIFRLIKFRTMSNAKGPDGNLLPDSMRLNQYGRFLRSTSLDELPELFNILVGDMAIVGPRPQLVRDMVFMTPEQRRRHSVRPGLTGLAQVNGRNCITWEKKFCWDLQYIDRGITLWGDLRIILQTVGKVFGREDIVREGTESDLDFGDYLLQKGEIDPQLYHLRQQEAKELMEI